MEVVVAEEKKKIFRARKTMKISDRQQLESLHSALSPSVRSSSNSSSPPPLLNGTHKEDVGQKGSDHKEQQSDAGDSKSPLFTPPESPGSPPLALSLSLSPSPPSGPSPRPKEDDPPSSPSSPFHCLNNELKKMEEEGKKKKNGRSPSPLSLEGGAAAGQEVGGAGKAEVAPEKKPGEATGTERKETHATTQDRATDQAKASAPPSPVLPATTSNQKPDKDQGAELQQGDSPAAGKDGARGTEAEAPEASTAAEERSGSPKTTTASPPPGASSPSPSAGPVSGEDMKEEEVKEEEEGDQPEKEETKEEEKMEVDFVKMEMKKEAKKEAKVEGAQSSSSSGSSSTSLSNKGAKEERKSSSGQKRPTSEDGHGVDREGKRPRMDGVELEAQLELKITAKAGSHHKLEKIVQEMVEKRLRGLQLTAFDLSLKDLKDRVEKYDKHQSAINTLQAKIARLAKKFGEANQSSENNKKQEIVTSSAAKTASAINTTPSQRPVRTSMEIKQTLTPVSTHLSASPSQLKPTTTPSTTTSTAMVTQAPILQLITSNATTSTLGSGPHQTQPTGTLLLKTTSRTNMVGQGQPLLIQLHPGLSMNGQGGTLVNIPVSSFAAVSSLNKAKTTTAFILKAAPSTTTTAANAAAIPALQASASQMSPAQISLARAVYQGGAGGIGTPHAGVSMTTARAPTHSVSVAGLVSSTSSLATSGPAATGSTAPGTPSGTTMTSKTDNQTTPTKTPVQGSRPKSSFIDLTEDDDDVLVTGVKKPTVTSASSLATQRPPGPPPLISTPTGPTARSSPQQSASNPQHTVHHRPPLDSPMKARAGNAGTPNRTTTTTTSAAALPPLPSAPQPPARLPLEAAQTSSPQQPQLKLARVQSQNGIVLSWCVSETDRSCAAVESYHLYAYHMDNSAATGPGLQHWKKIGEVKALPLPMACTLTQFVSGSTYYFAVRARDIYGRFGPFCEPQCTDVISAASS